MYSAGCTAHIGHDTCEGLVVFCISKCFRQQDNAQGISEILLTFYALACLLEVEHLLGSNMCIEYPIMAWIMAIRHDTRHMMNEFACAATKKIIGKVFAIGAMVCICGIVCICNAVHIKIWSFYYLSISSVSNLRQIEHFV